MLIGHCLWHSEGGISIIYYQGLSMYSIYMQYSLLSKNTIINVPEIHLLFMSNGGWGWGEWKQEVYGFKD